MHYYSSYCTLCVTGYQPKILLLRSLLVLYVSLIRFRTCTIKCVMPSL